MHGFRPVVLSIRKKKNEGNIRIKTKASTIVLTMVHVLGQQGL